MAETRNTEKVSELSSLLSKPKLLQAECRESAERGDSVGGCEATQAGGHSRGQVHGGLQGRHRQAFMRPSYRTGFVLLFVDSSLNQKAYRRVVAAACSMLPESVRL